MVAMCVLLFSHFPPTGAVVVDVTEEQETEQEAGEQ